MNLVFTSFYYGHIIRDCHHYVTKYCCTMCHIATNDQICAVTFMGSHRQSCTSIRPYPLHPLFLPQVHSLYKH